LKWNLKNRAGNLKFSTAGAVKKIGGNLQIARADLFTSRVSARWKTLQAGAGDLPPGVAAGCEILRALASIEHARALLKFPRDFVSAALQVGRSIRRDRLGPAHQPAARPATSKAPPRGGGERRRAGRGAPERRRLAV